MKNLETKLYRIWNGWSDAGSGDRCEIMRIRSYSIDDVIDYIKNKVLNYDVFYDELGDEKDLYLMIDVCNHCKLCDTDRDLCDDCENSEYIEIEEDNNIEPSFRLIDGHNYFIDLTFTNYFEKALLQVADEVLNEFKLSKRFN